jgi:hypothetical protein
MDAFTMIVGVVGIALAYRLVLQKGDLRDCEEIELGPRHPERSEGSGRWSSVASD